MRALVFAAMLLAGCDPGSFIEGRVVDTHGAPAVESRVRLRCPPGGPRSVEERTDADGAFQLFTLGCLLDECVVVASGTGQSQTQRRIAEICTKTRPFCGCVQARTTLVLGGTGEQRP